MDGKANLTKSRACSTCEKDLQGHPASLYKSGNPGGTRTLDPLIKSQLLYRLSYGVIFSLQMYGFFLI
jgi:hypothetical protein